MKNDPIGKSWEESGRSENVPALKSDRDMTIVQMKLEGKTSLEIASETRMKLKTVQNITSMGGRLYPVIQEFRVRSVRRLQESADDVAEMAKQDSIMAYENIRDMSLYANSDAGKFRASEKIMELAGISHDKSIRGHFQALTYDQALKKINQLFTELYQREVYEEPQSVIVLSSDPDSERVEREYQRNLRTNNKPQSIGEPQSIPTDGRVAEPQSADPSNDQPNEDDVTDDKPRPFYG